MWITQWTFNIRMFIEINFIPFQKKIVKVLMKLKIFEELTLCLAPAWNVRRQKRENRPSQTDDI